MSAEVEDAFGVVQVDVEQRAVTNADVRRLVALGVGLSPRAEFSIEEHSGGGSFILSLRENVDTGVGHRA